MRFATETVISAPPATVWKILTDLEGWPLWNTTIDSVAGTVELGGKVTLSVRANPGRSFPLKVTELQPDSRMVWEGGMPLGLFKGVRTFSLEPVSEGTRFSMVEEYSGPMSGPITKKIPDLQPSFDEFAACLKEAAEAHGPA
jgi:uncharacterized protein YndB with AHSA1/START domain